MGLYSDILLTADFDRTLTDLQGNIPQKNIEAICYFMENGGTFTVNTGRSIPYAREVVERVPMNAPLLAYNGAVAVENGEILFCHTIALPMEETLKTVCEAFPDLSVALHGLSAHYDFQPHGLWEQAIHKGNTIHLRAKTGVNYGPFIKFNVYCYSKGGAMDTLFSGKPEEIARVDAAEQWLRETYAGKLEVYRSGAKLLNVQAAGVSKLNGARQLQKCLYKRILVCVGDEGNDLPMLEGADYAYCPADGALADRFPNVCACGDGAIADAIYQKIPNILENNP